MVVKNFIQFNSKEVNVEEIVKKAKEVYKENGGLVKEIKTIENYIIPGENAAYCVINKENRPIKISL